MTQTERLHEDVLDTDVAEPIGIDRLLTLLSDGDRRAVVDHLAIHARGEAVTIGELAFAVGVSRFSMSRHVQAMREAGLVSLTKSGNRVMVRLTPEPMRVIDDWVWSVVEAMDGRPA
jgi:DNA-binding transcriptional ArsR family regulator